MSASESVTRWFSDLKSGGDHAARQIWQQYSEALLQIARAQVEHVSPAFDEEDVVQSAFRTVFRRAAKGEFDQLVDRTELWALLVKVTFCKAINRRQFEQRQKRGAGRVKTEAEFSKKSNGRGLNLDAFAGAEPPPEVVAMLAEEQERLMAKLRDETLRDIAAWKLDGMSNAEIAQRLEISTRSVERKLGLIRDEWRRELVS